LVQRIMLARASAAASSLALDSLSRAAKGQLSGWCWCWQRIFTFHHRFFSLGSMALHLLCALLAARRSRSFPFSA
jgi:hypothetical protein